MRWVRAALVLAFAGFAWADSSSVRYDWRLPAWAPVPLVPSDNPMTAAKVTLGRHLFYDKRLSVDRSMSCASCHQQAKAFSDGLPVHAGVDGRPGLRNAMSLTNVAYLPTLTWANPLLRKLETQALVPLFGEHPIEMGMAGNEGQLFARLRADAQYRDLFHDAFPLEKGEISLSTITMALASFERSLLSFDSPYDRYTRGGDASALSVSARRGEALFFGERLECYHCHGGTNFTDNHTARGVTFPELGYHNTGLYNLDGRGAYPADNPGIREFTGEPDDEGRFRTPTLRNVALTGPYMHDGSIATLEQVIRKHYARAGRAANHGNPSPLRDPLVAGFTISEDEVRDVVAFLASLTDSAFITDERFSDPFVAAAPTTH